MLRTFLIPLLFTSLTQASTTHEVEMRSISFQPKSLTLKVGDSVEWKNVSYTEHSATGDGATPAFDTGLVQPKASSKKIQFEKSGTFPYHCSIHGRSMSGSIVVQP